jgi:2,3-bisphosphoglycerate-independent phosphoglycerate mutase
MNGTHGAPRRPVILIILDGVGVNPGKHNNAVAEANTPVLDQLFDEHPHTLLRASGQAVGLPDGQMGNSEVGHLTLGAGSIILQDIMKINVAIDSGEFYQNPVFLDAIYKAKKSHRPVHLLGLVSDGGIHSSLEHLLALIYLCKQHDAHPLLHMVTDGRDAAPQSALEYLGMIEPHLHEAGGAVASIMGRYYAMDRDHRWDRTELAWRTLVSGKAEKANSAHSAICSAYAAGDTDEFIRPIKLPTFMPLAEGDQIISFNFRKDRPRQIVASLSQENFAGFDRGACSLFDVTCMMPYDRTFGLPYAYAAEKPDTTLGQVVSSAGLSQLHCAETEKYPHVTYFFNGGKPSPYSLEKQLLIPSPHVATYDQKPEMSADKVADAVIAGMAKKEYGFILVNFANGDMVGHTARHDAVIHAVEVLDRELGRVVQVAELTGYSVVITADHGNCEELIDSVSQAPHTRHTLNPVPFIVIDSNKWHLSCDGGLANVAPTVLQLMGLAQPDGMNATSLLLKGQKDMIPSLLLEGVA